MALYNQVPITMLPPGNGAAGNPPAPQASDLVPVAIYDPAKAGGPGYRTAKVPFSSLLQAPLNTRLSPRIMTTAGVIAVDNNDSYIAVNKTVAAATSVVFPLAANKNGDCVIKDAKGDSDIRNITISFTGGELCDGLSTVVIMTPFDEFRFIPRPGGGGYYLGK
jgi:hypothetical protein